METRSLKCKIHTFDFSVVFYLRYALLSFKGVCHFLESLAEVTILQLKAVDNILVKRNPKQVSLYSH